MELKETNLETATAQEVKVEPGDKIVDVKNQGLKPTVPMDQNEKFIKDLLKVLQTRMFEFHYRAKYRPAISYILALNLDDAREKANDYCERFGIRFISVTPFFLNLEKNPRDFGDEGVGKY